MKNLIKTNFDETYDKLSDYIPVDFTFANLNTKNYIEYLNDCIDKNGERYFKNKKLAGIHTHHIWPISLGGPDEYWNKIDLKYYQHRDAHLKLALDNPDNLEAQRAAQRLCYDPETGEMVKAADYIKILKNIAKLASIRNILDNPNSGKHMTDAERTIASQKGKDTSSSGNRVVVTYTDGTQNIFDSVSECGRVLFGTYANSYGQVNKILNGGREIPKSLKDIVVSIKYEKPEEVIHINNAENNRPVIGINVRTAEETGIFSSTREAASYLIDNKLVDVSNYKDPKASLAGKITADADNNKPNNLRSGDKLAYNSNFGYYWIDANTTPQLKGRIKKFIKDNILKEN